MPTIAVDFDGVISEYQSGDFKFDTFGKADKNIVTALMVLKKNGWKIIVHTCRPATEALVKFLEVNQIPYDEINRNTEQPDTTNLGKPQSDVYLDDRAVNYHGQDVTELLKEIQAIIK